MRNAFSAQPFIGKVMLTALLFAASAVSADQWMFRAEAGGEYSDLKKAADEARYAFGQSAAVGLHYHDTYMGSFGGRIQMSYYDDPSNELFDRLIRANALFSTEARLIISSDERWDFVLTPEAGALFAYRSGSDTQGDGLLLDEGDDHTLHLAPTVHLRAGVEYMHPAPLSLWLRFGGKAGLWNATTGIEASLGFVL